MRLENSQSRRQSRYWQRLTAEALKATQTIWLLGKHGAGGGGRTRTELSLQRILSPLSLALTMRNYWFYFFQHVKMCNFMCRF
jgi:hypothetical protein